MLLIDGEVVVAVEVKSRFRHGHLERMEEKLVTFRKAFPQYKDYTIHGAAAALKYDAGLDKLAEKRGFFVFRPGERVMRLVNRKTFRPRAF
jgi:hypothetical protein